MPFELKEVVPWGRNLFEYIQMFNLSEDDLQSSICSFGDGPASFNAQMNLIGNRVVSLDPLYQFSKKQIENRIVETKETVIQQTRTNISNFVWKNICNIEALEQIRTEAMNNFLADFENGFAQGRYVNHAMPVKTNFHNYQFNLGLSSHFLILYSQLGIEFHIQSLTEMLRICKEVRVFPLLNLNAEKSEVLDDICKFFNKSFQVEIKPVNYEFQRNGNKMLIIKNI